jgi:hypothetical protein
MNEDIKILREALADYDKYVDVENPLAVPLHLYKKARDTYRAECDPDRIRRLLDDAERYQWMRDKAPGEINFDHTRDESAGGNFFAIHIPFDGRPIDNDEASARTMDEAIDQARKS